MSTLDDITIAKELLKKILDENPDGILDLVTSYISVALEKIMNDPEILIKEDLNYIKNLKIPQIDSQINRILQELIGTSGYYVNEELVYKLDTINKDYYGKGIIEQINNLIQENRLLRDRINYLEQEIYRLD